jgi:arylsulfatase A-like enzyme
MKSGFSQLAAILLFACVSICHAAEQPHVLLIMIDDMGWKDLHCQGNDVLQTPHVDELAKQGVRFTNAYAAAPVCSPTRGALITGLAPARLHITQHGADGPQFWPDDRVIQPPTTQSNLPLETTTLAERLKAAGYATGFFGKWHLGSKEFWPTEQGFDVNLGGCGYGGPPTYFDPYRIPSLPPRKEGEYLTDRLADEAISFLQRQKDRPMFVCLWTYNVHYPFEAPEELVPHYEGKEGPGLKNPIYGGQVEATDRAVGRVLDELDRLQLTDETLVIFTSDNGGWMGATDNRPLRAGKGYLYEGGLRVPLIVRWPGVTKAGTENATPVISMDLTATILDATGIELASNESLDGVSLRPLFEGKELTRDALFFHYPHFAFHKDNRPGSAIRRDNFKLILNYDDDSTELYDLENDPGERQNLAGSHPELTAKLRHRLKGWLEETKAGRPTRRE